MKKLIPMWSVPNRVSSRLRNGYTLETVGGLPINGLFSARRLRAFEPRPGTKLAWEELQRLEQLETPEEREESTDTLDLTTLWGESDED